MNYETRKDLKMNRNTTKCALALWALLWAWPTLARAEKVAYLGVVVTSVDATLREQLKIERGLGLRVSEVMAESPADKAGLKAHDILEKLDDQLLFNGAQFASLVRSLKTGEKVTLAVIRQGQPKSIEATLGETEWSDTSEANLLEDNATMWNKLSKEPGFNYSFRMTKPELYKGALKNFMDKFQPPGAGVFLGVEVQTVDPSLAAQLGLEEDTGVLVGHVMANSPAQKAGLKEHDVIVKTDGEPVNGHEAFAATIRAHKQGDKIKLGIIRAGKAQDLEATLSQRELPGTKSLRSIQTQRATANTSSVTAIQSDEGKITITDKNGNRHATVTGPDEDTLFEGPINSAEERSKVPPAILERIEKTEQDIKPGPNPMKGVKDLQVWPGSAKPFIIRYQNHPEPGGSIPLSGIAARCRPDRAQESGRRAPQAGARGLALAWVEG